MSIEWIKMRKALFTHPKVVRIASALNADTLRTVGGLMSVWSLFDDHSLDGFLDGYTPQFIDSHLRWDGFAAQMMAVGWLAFDSEKGLSLPEFDAHNGQSAKRRAQDTERKRNARNLSASDADKTRTRKEKKRSNNPLPPEGVAGVACDYESIVKAYADMLPSLPQPRLMDDKRKKAMRKRWDWVLTSIKSDGTRRATNAEEAAEWFRAYFGRASKNAWLMGENPGKGHEGWKADLDFLMTDRGIKAVLERTEVAA